jgi:chemotaxis protein methyltransferase CheR
MGRAAVAAVMSGVPQPARRPVTPDVQGLRVPERTVALLRDLIESHAGVRYDDDRLDLLRDRLAPLAIDRGFDSLLDYYYLLKYDAGAAVEWPRVMDALSVQETYFWREADQFQALVTAIMPRLAGAGAPVRIWSAPCATGEEPLSIAMALEEAGWFGRVRVEIHASDASDAALARARAGRYGPRSFRQLTAALWEKYFRPVPGAAAWTPVPELTKRVSSWSRVNMMNALETAGRDGSDVIFCRNMFIYFSPSAVRDVVARLGATMPSPGFLCVGAAESLLRLQSGFELQDLGGAYVYVKS